MNPSFGSEMDPETKTAEDLPSNSGNSHELIHPPSPFPDEVLEKVLSFIDSHRDRGSISLVRKDWYSAERWTRSKLFIGNCYAVSPEIVARRFRRIKSVTLKGKPRFSDFNMLPLDWGANVHSWLVVFAKVYPFLEELRLKRMTVTDESLELLAKSFPGFKALSLSSCDGFSENGLKAIASHCRVLLSLRGLRCREGIHCPMKRAVQLRLGFMTEKSVLLRFSALAISKQVSPFSTPTTLLQLTLSSPNTDALSDIATMRRTIREIMNAAEILMLSLPIV